MISEWFSQYFHNANVYFHFARYDLYFNFAQIFGLIMFFLTVWAYCHLFSDVIMAFRAVFGFGYKKRKGGSH